MEELRFCQRCGSGMETEQVEGHQRRICPACGLVLYLDPKLVAAALVEHEGRVLLVRRNLEPGRGLWALPGGYVERGEAVEKAVLREVLEETGLTVAAQALVGLYSEEGSPIVLAVYAARIVSGTLSVHPQEIQEAAYFSVDALPPLAFPRDRRIINDWLHWRHDRQE